MALRNKRYVEEGRNAPPVSTPPTEAAKLPDPAPDAKPPEPIVESSPADEAGRAALKQRLKEMENAERFTREAIQQQAHVASEPPPQEPQDPQDPMEAFLATVPEATRNWLRAHPEYMRDPRKNAALQHFHWIAKDETGEEFTPRYIERIEHHLGMRRPQPSSNGNGSAAPTPVQRQSAPVSAPARDRMAAPVSAPPTRDVPSMTTGRSQSGPVRLTAAQVEIAQASGISPEEYARQLQKMERMRAAGELDDRRR
jgi:hypothetical protein